MKRAIAAAVALSLLCGTAAMAQPAQYQRDYQPQYQQGDRYDSRDSRYDSRDNRYERRDDRRGGQWRSDRGQQRHAWRQGERLPSHYRGSSYYVNDYGRYGLRAPPRGYHWVRADNDYVLAALATGLIIQVLSNGNSYGHGYGNGYHR